MPQAFMHNNVLLIRMIYPDDMKTIGVKSGVYAIKNLANGKVYVGSAMCFKRRWSRHICLLESGRHDNAYLQAEYKKYGSQAFAFYVLEVVENAQTLICKENEHLLKWHDNQKECYNICLVGNSRLGIKHTQNAKDKISKAHKNKPKTPAHCAKIGQAHKGRTHTTTHNERFAQSRAKTYDVKIVSPDGRIFGPLHNLRKFCREHGLNQAEVWKLISHKTVQTKGWKLVQTQ